MKESIVSTASSNGADGGKVGRHAPPRVLGKGAEGNAPPTVMVHVGRRRADW